MKKHFSTTIACLIACATVSAGETLPKADVLLDKQVEAAGGKAAYSRIHSEISTATMEIPERGMKAKLTTYGAEPNLRLQEGTIDGVGTIREGTNGEVAWSISPNHEPRIKEGADRDEALLNAAFDGDGHWRELYQTAETVGVDTINGKECYKVQLKTKTGIPETRWLDKKTGLMLKGSRISKSDGRELEIEMTLSDFRREGEILQAHKVESAVAGMRMIITLDSMQYNVEIAKDKFALPEEVQALLKNEK
jgi:hypothetical protein